MKEIQFEKITINILLILILTCSFKANSQDVKIDKPKLNQYLLGTSEGSFMDFIKTFKVKPDLFFKEFKNELGLSNDDRMIHFRTDIDVLGMEHLKYGQSYKGIPVEGAEYVIHRRSDNILRSNGIIIKQLNVNTIPSITKEEAFEKTKRHVNAKKYKWETDASFLPQPELIITKESDNPNMAIKYVLAYKISIYSLIPFGHKDIYIDANSGKVLKEENKIHADCVSGTVNTLYNGTQTLHSTYQSIPHNYRLEGDCSTRKIHTKNYSTNGEITDSDNDWDNTNDARIGGSLHWALESAYEYYFVTFGRRSYDNKNAKVNAFIHNNTEGAVNAFWDGSSMHFGDGNSSTKGAVVSLDITAHELTHAVTQYSAALKYSYESGALNESFSDIFGTAVEFFVKGSEGNYLIGDEIYNNNYFRSMSNPNARSQPDTYTGSHWYSGSGDNGGVHTNSGVQNYCFYLLSEGGSGTNDKGNNYDVSGIGITNASAIFYRALTVYLTSTSKYSDSRNACIRSAQDLFGAGSAELQSVINAWYAAGVGSNSTIDVYACGDYNSTGNTLFVSAYNNIYAGNYCDNEYTNINSGADVIFTAYNSILLGPGFNAVNGSNFSAKIGDWNNPPANLRVTQQEVAATYQNYNAYLNDNKEDGSNINIYPNPTQGIFNITFQDSKNTYLIEVMDMMGNKVLSESVASVWSKEYNITGLRTGLYYINIKTNGNVQRKKVWISR